MIRSRFLWQAEILWEKEKMLVSCIFSFFQNVFKWSLSHVVVKTRYCIFTLSSIYTHIDTFEKKSIRKALWKKVKLLKMSNFTFFHNVFYAICILRSYNSNISVVVCSFFEFWTVSKLCIREMVKGFSDLKNRLYSTVSHTDRNKLDPPHPSNMESYSAPQLSRFSEEGNLPFFEKKIRIFLTLQCFQEPKTLVSCSH